MTKDEAIAKMKEKGADDAAALRTKANIMTGTEIIAAEIAVPDFNAQKDYSACPVGTPVADEGQVWTLIQPTTQQTTVADRPLCARCGGCVTLQTRQRLKHG